MYIVYLIDDHVPCDDWLFDTEEAAMDFIRIHRNPDIYWEEYHFAYSDNPDQFLYELYAI